MKEPTEMNPIPTPALEEESLPLDVLDDLAEFFDGDQQRARGFARQVGVDLVEEMLKGNPVCVASEKPYLLYYVCSDPDWEGNRELGNRDWDITKERLKNSVRVVIEARPPPDPDAPHWTDRIVVKLLQISHKRLEKSCSRWRIAFLALLTFTATFIPLFLYAKAA